VPKVSVNPSLKIALTENFWLRHWLDQQAVGGASSINAFKGCLNKIRETRMGFFMD